MSEQSNKPVKEFRVNGGISASVWRNTVTVEDGRTVVRHSVRFQKRYMNKSGQWADSTSYYPKDLPLLRLVIDEAFEYISTARGNEEDANEPVTPFDAAT